MTGDQPLNEKRTSKAVKQIDEILNWLKQVEAKPDLPRPAILGPPIKVVSPTRPPVIRKGVVMDDMTIEQLQNDPPYSTWVLETTEGKEYGPVEFDILRDWVADGRVDVGAKLLRADWQNWEPAEQLFSEMVFEDVSDEPIDEPGITPS